MRRKFCLQGCTRIFTSPASRKAKPSCCVARVVQEAAKPFLGLQLLSQTVSQFVCPRFAFGQGDAFLTKKLIHVFNMGGECGEFPDLRLVSSFRLGQELLIEMLDLRNPLRNEGIEPADRSRE